VAWLILLVLVVGTFCFLAFGTSALANSLPSKTPPKDLGETPTAYCAPQMTPEVRTTQGGLSIGKGLKSGEPTGLQDSAATKNTADTTPQGKPPETKTQDTSLLVTMADRAEKALQQMQWDDALSTAQRLMALSPPSEIAQRATRVSENAPKLKNLFSQLNQRDELCRNLETHPSLVRLTVKGHSEQCVPLESLSNRQPFEGPDPIRFIKDRSGKVAVMAPKSWIGTSYELKDIEKVERADVASVKAQAVKTLESREARIAEANLEKDAVSWYEAARFAYQNRLPDERVVALLEKAVAIAPDLATTLREDKAQSDLNGMMHAAADRNEAQVSLWINQIRQKYPETNARRDAEVVYARFKGTPATAVAVATPTQKPVPGIKPPTPTGITPEPPLPPPPPPPPTEDPPISASGDLAKALESMKKADALFGQAYGAPATKSRDQWYYEAQKLYEFVIPILEREIQKGRKDLEEIKIRCNGRRHDCMKMRRV
jgi:tetratricopeptide (TPR) repeat protein